MDYHRKKYLFKRYNAKLMTDAELEEFYKRMLDGEFEDDYDQIMAELYHENKEKITVPPNAKAEVEKRLDGVIFEKKTKSLKWLWRAASVAAILVALVGGYRWHENYQYDKLTHTYTTVSVSQGTMKILQLNDGTKVTLSPGATFRYPKQFEKDARQVYLDEGRAYFDVAKDKTKPFTVHSERLATTALGTSFIVQNYREYGYEKISLYTGSVKIDQPGDNHGGSIILVPGQEFEKDMGHSQNLVHQFDVNKDPMTAGTLVFNKDRMDVVLYNIASHYHVKLDFNPEMLKSLYVTGTYRHTKVEEVLKSIAFTHKLMIKNPNPKTFQIMKK
ncbi:FecR domain-containing protein [Sphingobacterium hotanense]|uniref:FecR domain-containing protein n=1 Tax=Sphingobacterium hotanense TaxID=649196 RepID=UPI0021A53574|nr:FecR domain-containing protein [Sphingobacterium hotanense]MCT1526979.1 FecR domain-containing protein [Sphingobacterium hotanense]